mmetsp:Transcript_14403/g.35985  ORF Transcript_14403/g.35985 Transcript_14403/m.35985 type:complete len:245 (+) Transcript_14403:1582-2316(+)
MPETCRRCLPGAQISARGRSARNLAETRVPPVSVAQRPSFQDTVPGTAEQWRQSTQKRRSRSTRRWHHLHRELAASHDPSASCVSAKKARVDLRFRGLGRVPSAEASKPRGGATLLTRFLVAAATGRATSTLESSLLAALFSPARLLLAFWKWKMATRQGCLSTSPASGSVSCAPRRASPGVAAVLRISQSRIARSPLQQNPAAEKGWAFCSLTTQRKGFPHQRSRFAPPDLATKCSSSVPAEN